MEIVAGSGAETVLSQSVQKCNSSGYRTLILTAPADKTLYEARGRRSGMENDSAGAGSIRGSSRRPNSHTRPSVTDVCLSIRQRSAGGADVVRADQHRNPGLFGN